MSSFSSSVASVSSFFSSKLRQRRQQASLTTPLSLSRLSIGAARTKKEQRGVRVMKRKNNPSLSFVYLFPFFPLPKEVQKKRHFWSGKRRARIHTHTQRVPLSLSLSLCVCVSFRRRTSLGQKTASSSSSSSSASFLWWPGGGFPPPRETVVVFGRLC